MAAVQSPVFLGQGEGQGGTRRTFKDKLMNMVAEAEMQEQLALKEAQTQDRKSLAIALLIEGRPQAFVDFFQLTHHNMDGAASTSGAQNAHMPPGTGPGELPQESLLLLKSQLAKADAAAREGKTEDVYGCYKQLAKYFAQMGRLRTAEFFFKQCLNIATEAAWAPGELEANLALGVVYEELKDTTSAIACHERRLQLATEHTMAGDMDTAFQSLTQVYQKQAEQQEKMGDAAGALESYGRCLNVAERARDYEASARASFRMGMLYHQQGKWHDAMFHLRRFLETGAGTATDKTAEGVAQTTLAQCLRATGDTAGAVASLEHYLDSSSARGQDQSGPAIACCSLGNLYYEQEKFEQAVTYFERFFELARSLGDRKILDAARFNLGVARGTLRRDKFMGLVAVDLPRLIQWKNGRIEF